MFSMAVDHFAAIFLDNSSLLCQLLRHTIGRLAFPIFTVLFVHGMCRTSKPWRHMLDLLLFALISEIWYDFAFGSLWMDLSMQNVMWLWLFCAGMIMACQHITKSMYDVRNTNWKQYVIWAGSLMLICLVCSVVAEVWRADYGASGVVMAFLIYLGILYRNKVPLVATYAFACVCLSVMTNTLAFLAVPFVCLYDSEKGMQTNRSWLSKYFCYIFYPLHLCIFVVIRVFCFE